MVRGEHEGQTVTARDLERGQGQELAADPVVVDQDVLRAEHPLHHRPDLGGDAFRRQRDHGVVGEDPGRQPQPGRLRPGQPLDAVVVCGPPVLLPQPEGGAQQPVGAVLAPECCDIRPVAGKAMAQVGDVCLHPARRGWVGRGRDQDAGTGFGGRLGYLCGTRWGEGCQLQDCMPSGVKAMGTTSPPSRRRRSATAGRQSKGQ